jgi:hypothetical protein
MLLEFLFAGCCVHEMVQIFSPSIPDFPLRVQELAKHLYNLVANFDRTPLPT